MFIKRNRTSIGSKSYSSVLLVQGKRVPAKRPAGRPSIDAGPPKTVVVHQTLANLSKLPAELIDVIESFCRSSGSGSSTAGPSERSTGAEAPSPDSSLVHLGPCYGLLAGLHALAKELGIVAAVGDSTQVQRLALFLVYARLARQGSRLSAVRWGEDHAVREVLEVGSFDEEDLYAALDYLESQQKDIEAALNKSTPKGALFLYDVSSGYFQGLKDELAQFSYNRDGQMGNKQMICWLLTDGAGEPLAIQLYPGNSGDPPTFLDAVKTLQARFGAEEIALVGDQSMIQQLGKQALGETKFRYVTALTDPQICLLLKNKTLPLDLLNEKPAEVEVSGKRYVLRCNPHTQARKRARRADQWLKLQRWIQERNAWVEKNPRTNAENLLREAQARLQGFRLTRWITLRLENRAVFWTEDHKAKEAEEQLDGCYVVETDLSVASATTEQVHNRHLDLTQLERDFRTMKTGLFEIRPVSLRKATRTRGHAMVSLLALKLARELDGRMAPLGLTLENALGRLEGVRLVSLEVGEQKPWRLADSYPAAQQEVLAKLPKLPSPMMTQRKANKNRLVDQGKG